MSIRNMALVSIILTVAHMVSDDPQGFCERGGTCIDKKEVQQMLIF